ncbi:hypothetical protein GCM10028790_41780 [Micromonospora taraxaci]
MVRRAATGAVSAVCSVKTDTVHLLSKGRHEAARSGRREAVGAGAASRTIVNVVDEIVNVVVEHGKR